ncbi:hypothetical protein PVAND_003577 [Polypedilum vanderplanki]|uniref:THAP-type domain-containing protein n=1 Tax=Polypedilum vanderplanki TaxID=319348 RepID=A0A9J6BUG9_POLVA|nr:hypothetical protein PVAND_003577 [Polypedilum vanderplanki]
MAPIPGQNRKHLANCSITSCRQAISDSCSLHVFPNERDPRRKQWIKVLKVERDVPRHFRICSKHFKSSDFFPRHQMQKKLMLRPTAIPSENLPTEMTNYSHVERSDSPENSTSSSHVSADHHHHLPPVHTHTQHQSDSSSNNNVSQATTHHQVITVTNNNLNNLNNNNNINHHSEYQDEVKIIPENYTYHPTTTPIVQTTAIATSASFQASAYETLLTPLSTVPYQEISEEPMYMISDGSEIDRNRLASVLNKDDYGDGTVTYVVNFVDY